MKKLLLLFTLFNLFQIGFSQIIGINYLHKNHYDKLEIDCRNDIVVNLRYPAYNYTDSLTNLSNTIDLLINTVKPILKNLNIENEKSYSITIEYPITCSGIECRKKENFKVSVIENELNSKEYWATEFGETLTPKLINKIQFKGDYIQILISDLSRLDSLESINFKKCLNQYSKKVFQEKLYKYDLSSKFSYSQNVFKIDYVKYNKKRKPYLAIRPSIGIGAGLVKGQLVNNGTILIESSFNDYSKYAIRLYAQYEYVANYDKKSIYSSGFVNLGANLNLSDDYEPKDWLGFGIGYLVHRQNGSVFNENTLKIFFERQVKIGLKIRPEVYFDTVDEELFLGFMISMNL
jgi:hypothetical protein